MKSRFRSGKNLLIAYLTPDAFRKMAGFDHPDPSIDEFTYGEGGGHYDFLRRNLGIGSYIFFHTSIGGQRYITAYYVVSSIKEGYQARHDDEIRRKYMNPHIHPSIEWWGEEYDPDKDNTPGDLVVFGDPDKSRNLRDKTLLFDRDLAEKLEFEGSKKIRFDIVDKNGRVRKDAECIVSATRHPRILTDDDVQLLLQEIETRCSAVTPPPAVLTAEELEEEETEILSMPYPLKERDIEQMIHMHPEILEEGSKVLNRQLRLPNGRRVDLLLQDKHGNLIVTEIKEGTAPDDVLTQIQMYVKNVKGMIRGKNVMGAIVCEDCSAPLKDAAENSGVRIYYFELKPSLTRVV